MEWAPQIRAPRTGSDSPAHHRRVATLAAELARRLRVNASNPRGLEATRLWEVAEAFVTRIEAFPPEPGRLDQILDEMNWLAQQGRLDPAATAALARLACVRMEDLLATVHRLPVFPAVAVRVLGVAGSDEASFEEIQRLVSSDQVLAGRIIEAANSSLLSPARPISTIPQALSYIGLERTRRVLLAHVFRPLYKAGGLEPMWRHSIQMAIATERLASLSKLAPPEEAFLAGLMHDIGRLALRRMGGAEAELYARLCQSGSDAVFAELILCGFDHGLAGAEILRGWAFPAHLVESVQRHHAPLGCRQPLAWLVYVAEGMADPDGQEAPACEETLRAAFERLGLDGSQCAPRQEPESALLAHLLEAA